ncbi:MAG: NUDIX domain-containing protein [Methanomassiliicoccaceae archaeon]|jgi:8-oxo-dGTP diphosphatase|nr:NUDIX domain-containing protein [Methanomassiliicoccaceae archaeon]
MSTVYTVAFSGSRFLMVYNSERCGWEMPGGKMEDGESVTDAALREYLEESGYVIDIVSVTAMNGCMVCAAVLGERAGGGEMASELFPELPECLAFGRREYDGVLEWARSVLGKRGC